MILNIELEIGTQLQKVRSYIINSYLNFMKFTSHYLFLVDYLFDSLV